MLVLSLASCGGNNADNNSQGDSPINDDKPLTRSTPAADPKEGNEPSESIVQPTGKLTLAITPVDGWEAQDASSEYPAYDCADGRATGATISIMYPQNFPANVNTAEDYVKFIRGTLMEGFEDMVGGIAGDTGAEGSVISGSQYGEITKMNVNGMDAYGFAYATQVMGFDFKFALVFVCKDNTAYGIQCCAFADDYPKIADDFQSMIDSLRLESVS